MSRWARVRPLVVPCALGAAIAFAAGWACGVARVARGGWPAELAPPRIGDPSFLRAAAALYAPNYGTEQMAPLLYWLARFQRPRVVVELGCGYSTPFLAAALADGAAAEARERATAAAGAPGARNLLRRYYAERRPRATLRSVDADAAAAARCRGVLAALGLPGTVFVGDGLAAVARLPDGGVDLLWTDGPGWTPAFLAAALPKLRPHAGVLALHNVEGPSEVAADPWSWGDLQTALAIVGDGHLEVLTLGEPHKKYQGAVALVRRTDAALDESRVVFNEVAPVPGADGTFGFNSTGLTTRAALWGDAARAPDDARFESDLR